MDSPASPQRPPARRRLKILRVITWLPVGGIERRLVAVLPRLNRDLFDVQLVCIRERGALADELEAAGVPVTLIPFKKRWDLAAIHRLAAFMREQRIDLVHSHMYRANVPATVAARLAGVRPVWCQVHNTGTWETARQAWMDRQLCRWRAGMIAVSERVRQDVIDRLALPPEKVELIYNGVDIARFAGAKARRGELRAQLGVKEDSGDGSNGEVVFLFAARLVEQKHATDFLEAFGRLQREEEQRGLALPVPVTPASSPVRPRPVAWILGDGPLLDDLRRQAAALPDPTAVRFHGKVANVEDYMAAADIFVLPSTKEGFSNALIEALATGLPAIASDVGGNAEAVRDGVEGCIIQPLRVNQLAAAMADLWQNAELRKKMSAAAAARAKLYSLDRMIAQVEELYLRSADQKARSFQSSTGVPPVI